MPNLDFLLNKLFEQNPGLKDNQNAMSMIDVIRRNDQKQGEELAMNILNTYGITKEQGLQMAKQHFGIR